MTLHMIMSKRKWILVICFIAGIAFVYIPAFQAGALAQIPTVDIPTVTGTPLGPRITVKSDQDQINVRSGPDSIAFPVIGVLIAGQQVPALGRTPAGLWIKISYPGVPGGVGWVYSPLVNLVGDLPIVEPPPTPTPRTTPTIDPTLAAQFIVVQPPTRLPTFTPPPPLVIPTFPSRAMQGTTAGVPVAFAIIGLGIVGLFGMLISFIRTR
jgi:hypothetical protein